MFALCRAPFEHGTSLEIRSGDKVISGLHVFDVRLRVGGVVVRCGGIGDVFTERSYRLQGLARQSVTAAISFMREEGYHLSYLFGIPNFYPKFGYASAMVGSECTMATRDAEAAVPHHATREATAADMPIIAHIYETLHAHRTASAVRDPATWKGFRLGSRWQDRVSAFVVEDGAQIIGYASYDLDHDRCSVAEVGCLHARACDSIIARCAELALARRVERITFLGPPDDAFIRYCRRYGCEAKQMYPRNAHGMARLIDQRGLFVLLEPLLRRRLHAAGLGDGFATLVLETDLGSERLPLGHGQGDVHVQLPQAMLAQLVVGFLEARDLLADTEAHANQAATPTLEALFPQGYPYIWSSDRF